MVDIFEFGIIGGNFLFFHISEVYSLRIYYFVIRVNFNFQMMAFLYIMMFPLINMVPNYKKDGWRKTKCTSVCVYFCWFHFIFRTIGQSFKGKTLDLPWFILPFSVKYQIIYL